MYGGRFARRSPARYLAPLALAASITATILVVEHGLRHSAAPPHSARASPAGRSSGGPAPVRHGRLPRFYTVRPGDTLSEIAARTGVALSTLQALNPSVSPDSLQPGQRLRLRR